MKVLLQRVKQASVEVEGKTVGAIQTGLLLLTGLGKEDTEGKIEPMAKKIANLRIFPDEQGRFDRSLLEINAHALVVPQFTLFADTSKGRRPEFFNALKPELASPLVENFVEALKLQGVSKVEKGVFGAHMTVSLVNDGPVTIMIES